MASPIHPLIARGHDIPDPRHPRGRRHALAALLALMCVATRCGYRSDSAMADWGRGYGKKLARAWGLTQAKTPGAATGYHVLRQLDGPLVEATLGAWAASVLTARPPAPGEPEALAREGKTLRGSRTHGAPAAHLRSARRHRVGLPRWPQAVADQTQAIPVRQDGLRALVVEGRVITVDAWLTPRASAPSLVAGDGDAVMLVNGNQPQLYDELHRVCHDAPTRAETLAAVETVAAGHGRLAQRRLTTSTALVGYSDWPGRAPVVPRERRATRQKTGAPRHEVVSGVTSRGPDQAGPERRLGLVRQPWPIETKVHGVRAVTCAAARSQGRCGSIPQVMAACRNTAIGLLRWAGETKIAAACRRFAAQPWSAFALLGIRPDH